MQNRVPARSSRSTPIPFEHAGQRGVLVFKARAMVADATPSGYHELARAKVHNSRCWVMPVLANGRIYAKTNKGELACLDVRTER